MDEIQELIQKLQNTEEERHKALDRLKSAVDESVKEMIDILYKLYSALSKEKLSIRNYSGQVYDIGDGIVVYSKGIEQKVILNKNKKLMHYQFTGGSFKVEELSPERFLSEIGLENIYHNIKELLKERIRANNDEILNLRKQTSKMQKYAGDLQREYGED